MAKIKSHKSVEQIAKKHRLDVDFIQNQLDIGEPIEHEHTKDHQLAMDIALQHLDEIPDYYTRLKKMEASAMKNHKKFKDVKEENDNALSDVDTPVHMPPVHGIHVESEKRYCAKCKKVELRSECKYGPKYWDLFSLPEKLKEATIQVESGEMKETVNPLKDPKTQIKKSSGASALTPDSAKQLGSKAQKLQKQAAAKVDIPRFEEKIVDKILGELKEDKKKGLWDNIHARKEKGLSPKKPGEKGYPKTLDIDEDLNQAKKNVGASKCWKGKKVGNPPTKIKGGKEVPNCVSAENVTIEDANGNTFAEVIDLIKPEPIKGFKSQVDEATRLQAQTGNVVGVTLNWRGKYYSLRMFFPQVKLPSRKEINDELQKVYPGCNVIYHSISEIQPGQPLIQSGLQGGSLAHPGSNKKYVKPCGEQVEFDEKYVPWDFGPKQKAKAKFEKLSQRKQTEVSTGVRGGKGTATRANRIASVGREMRITLDKDSAATATDPKKQGLQPSTKRHTAAARRGAGGGMTARKLYAHFDPEGEMVEDWQSVNRKDRTDGLSQKAVDAYRRENPGSKLQTAVTEKNPTGKRAQRRKNFCSRMSGMKKRLTSAETARDPDSRINKALRRWNCN